MGHFSVEWVYGPWPHTSYNTVGPVIMNTQQRNLNYDIDMIYNSKNNVINII